MLYLINDYFTPVGWQKEKLVEKLINEQIHKQLVDPFSKELVHSGGDHPLYIGCPSEQRYMEQLLEEVCSVSDLLALQTHDYESNQQLAEQYHLDKAPGVCSCRSEGDAILDYGIRFAGCLPDMD